MSVDQMWSWRRIRSMHIIIIIYLWMHHKLLDRCPARSNCLCHNACLEIRAPPDPGMWRYNSAWKGWYPAYKEVTARIFDEVGYVIQCSMCLCTMKILWSVNRTQLLGLCATHICFENMSIFLNEFELFVIAEFRQQVWVLLSVRISVNMYFCCSSWRFKHVSLPCQATPG